MPTGRAMGRAVGFSTIRCDSLPISARCRVPYRRALQRDVWPSLSIGSSFAPFETWCNQVSNHPVLPYGHMVATRHHSFAACSDSVACARPVAYNGYEQHWSQDMQSLEQGSSIALQQDRAHTIKAVSCSIEGDALGVDNRNEPVGCFNLEAR